MRPGPALQLDGVTKSYGEHQAVRGLSLTVPRGGVFGFIGPNGSGKTSTLRMVMDLIQPDSGRIRVLGSSAAAVRDRVSYLPEERGLYSRMSVRQVLRYYGRLKGAPAAALEDSITRWLGRLGLLPWQGHKVEALSKGMAQKVQFIAAVAPGPELLILDEPFSGLDPVNAHELRRAFKGFRAGGGTIIFSTHDINAAEELCDRVAMIFQGRKVLDGSIESIRRAHGDDRVLLRSGLGLAQLRRLPGVASARPQGRLQLLRLLQPPQRFLRGLARRTRVSHFELHQPSLNDIFLQLARPRSPRAGR